MNVIIVDMCLTDTFQKYRYMVNKSTKFGMLFPFGPLINISLGAQTKYLG